LLCSAFKTPPPFLTSRPKNHASNRNDNSIFLDFSPDALVKFLSADLCFGEILLVAQARCYLNLDFFREQAGHDACKGAERRHGIAYHAASNSRQAAN